MRSDAASRPISPPAARGPRNGDLPAYVSNGLIGLRVREIPLLAGMALVNGVVGEHPERRIEAAANVPYPLAGDIAVDGIWLRDQPWAASDLVQAYDFATGELTSRFVFSAAGRRVEVEVLTFASRTAAALVLQEVTVRVDAPCDLRLRALVDHDGVRGRVARRRTDTPGEPEPVCDGTLLWETEGGLSQCGVALWSEVLAPGEAARAIRPWDAEGPILTEYRLRATRRGAVRLRQITAMIPSLLHHRPDEEAVRRVWRGKAAGFDVLRRRNAEAWRDLWGGRIVIRGAEERHQALVDAAFFYLNSSVHPASPSATSIFGLATWHDYHYYYGHVMWDVDAFCLPPLILLQPDAARSLLGFRTRGIAAARAIARLSGRDGIEFPWEAAPLTGEEAAPGNGSAAAHEDHGSLHVGRAFSLYADITGDVAFREEDAWPVLSGLADWTVSRLTRTANGLELLRATGPAEVPDPPDNDAFTLMAMHDLLQRTIRVAEAGGRAVPPAWRTTLADIRLPHRADGAIVSHDGYRVDEEKGETPSPLAGLFPLDYPATDAERRRSLALYLDLWPRYVGAPMLPALYGVWAAMAGDRALALRLFEEGYAAYDQGRFHQCLEYRPDHPDSEVRAGPFFANLGGMLLGLLFGYAGLVVDDGDPADWARRKIVLPEGWDAIEVGRLRVRGRPARLLARQGADRAELTFLDDA